MNGRVFDWRLVLGALLAGGAAVAAALAMPVPPPATGAQAEAGAAMLEGVAEAAPEDLTAFLDIRRWGAPAPKPEPATKEPGPTLNPILAEMGYVGLIAVQDELAVLLALPEGEVVRMLPGDTLPDGRILVSATDDDLTLRGDDGRSEVLTLFPPLPAEPAPAAAPEGDSIAGADATLLPGSNEAQASP